MPRRLTLLLIPALLAAKCGRPVDEEVKPLDSVLNAPEVELQVASIDPNFGVAGASFSAEVFGNGFVLGSIVTIGGQDAEARFRDASTLAVTVPALSVGSYDIVVQNPDARATLRRGLTLLADAVETRCRATTIPFGYDSSVLDAGARGGIEGAATCLRDSTDFVRVEGHTDDRGTTEYNLALGQRRSDAVARYLVGLGVAPSRVQAISYGEERPTSGGTDEGAWTENRRVEILPGAGR